MMKIDEHEYIRIEYYGRLYNRDHYKIINKNSNKVLGSIKYFPPWRQFIFDAIERTLWNDECLAYITDFLTKLKETVGDITIYRLKTDRVEWWFNCWCDEGTVTTTYKDLGRILTVSGRRRKECRICRHYQPNILSTPQCRRCGAHTNFRSKFIRLILTESCYNHDEEVNKLLWDICGTGNDKSICFRFGIEVVFGSD